MGLEAFRKFSGQRAQLKAQLIDVLRDQPIAALETRVENFLGQLSHDLEQEALKELKGEL